MRASNLLRVFSVTVFSLVSSFTIAGHAPTRSTAVPPLYSATPRVHETHKQVVPTASKSTPLEVKRIQARADGHISVTPLAPEHQAALSAMSKNNVLLASLKRHHQQAICIIYPGSLKMNVQRIAAQHGWPRVVWTLPEDYRWVGKTRIKAQGIKNVLAKLLTNYPLQAQFYEGNHVVVIVARTI